jgi:hypothetical protein
MALRAEELLPTEAVLLTKNANAVIRLDEFGLSRFAFDGLMGVVGMYGKEAIGGRLYLTNYRLLFKSHAANRARGAFSVFLPTVRELRDTSSGIKRQIGVATATQGFTFVVWGVPALIAAIKGAKAGLDSPAVKRLADLAVAHRARLGDGLQIAQGLEAANAALTVLTHRDAAAQLEQAIRQGLGPVSLTAALNLSELLRIQDDDEGAQA